MFLLEIVVILGVTSMALIPVIFLPLYLNKGE